MENQLIESIQDPDAILYVNIPWI